MDQCVITFTFRDWNTESMVCRITKIQLISTNVFGRDLYLLSNFDIAVNSIRSVGSIRSVDQPASVGQTYIGDTGI